MLTTIDWDGSFLYGMIYNISADKAAKGDKASDSRSAWSPPFLSVHLGLIRLGLGLAKCIGRSFWKALGKVPAS